MGKSLSVLKRMRQNEKKKAANLYYKEKIKATRKSIKKLIQKGAGKEEIMKAYALYSSALDKAAKKNVIHSNNSARKKSRMNLLIKKFVLGKTA